MKLARLREEDGLIRGALWMLLILAIIAAVVLDGFSTFSAHQKVRLDAGDAADAAKHVYVQSTGNIAEARQSAEALLKSSGDHPISVKVGGSSDEPMFTVTAERPASTYVLKFGTHLPGIGKSIAKLLRPQATESSQ